MNFAQYILIIAAIALFILYLIRKSPNHRKIGVFLIALAVVILPTFTPEDLVTSIPLIAVSPAIYFSILLPIGIISLIAGLYLISK